ncbi:MAG: hypothetical protein ACTH0V_00715 [Microbacteriaceae bacterium]
MAKTYELTCASCGAFEAHRAEDGADVPAFTVLGPAQPCPLCSGRVDADTRTCG